MQIHIEHDNSLAVHTTGAIALRPTGNTQGSHYLLKTSIQEDESHIIIGRHYI